MVNDTSDNDSIALWSRIEKNTEKIAIHEQGSEQSEQVTE